MNLHNRSYDVIVAGAGAAGMLAAISAARTGAQTAILEHMEEAGKKLLITGNGKCNFTNRVQGMEYYRGQDPAFVLPVFRQFGTEETIGFFREIGVLSKEKRGGCYYPASEQAQALRRALLLELERLRVACFYGIGIRRIEKAGKWFVFDTKQGSCKSKACILATGGKAAKKTGSDGSGLPYLKGFGHSVTEFLPALVQMQGKQSFLKELAGVRAESVLKLYTNGTEIAKDRGELQFTEFGVSGIPAFQVSRFAVYALKEGKQVHVSVDFAPDLDGKELAEFLERQRQRRRDGLLRDTLSGILNGKLAPVLLRETGLSENADFSGCSRRKLSLLAERIKDLRVDIIGSKSFDYAQVCAGGALTFELQNDTMESRLVPGLFLAGELVDIDGMCGGYNLQWAWSSGWVAGKHAGLLAACESKTTRQATGDQACSALKQRGI